MKRILPTVAAGLLFVLAANTTYAADQAYLDRIASKIVTNYNMPGGFDVVAAKVGFDLDAHGNVDHLRLLSDSDAPAEGQSSITRSALIKAIKKSAPFPSPGPVKKSLKLVALFKKTAQDQPVVCTVQIQ